MTILTRLAKLLSGIANNHRILTRMQSIHCEGCDLITPNYDIINYKSAEQEGYKQLCSQCFNTEIARLYRLDDFEHVKFEPVRLADCTGKSHEFHFSTRLFGTGVALDAIELCNGHPDGYKFQVIGHPEDDLLALLGRLIEKMRRGLSVKHLDEDKFGLQIADHQIVRGRIECDADNDDRMPLLVVDGIEITWQEMGRMLMTFEGFQFKLEIRDKSEEV